MQTLFRQIKENSAKWTGKQGQPAETGMSWRVWESRTCFNEAQIKTSKNIVNRETVFKFLGGNETVWRIKDSRVHSPSQWHSMPGRQLSAQMELLVSKMLWVLFWFYLLPISQSPFLLPLFSPFFSPHFSSCFLLHTDRCLL